MAPELEAKKLRPPAKPQSAAPAAPYTLAAPSLGTTVGRARHRPSLLTPDDVLNLQQLAGNRAAAGLFPDQSTLKGVIEQSYRPIRVWLHSNTVRARDYTLETLVHTIKHEVPEARSRGDGEIEMLAREWAREIKHTIPQPVPPTPGAKLPDIGLDKVLKPKLNLCVGSLEFNLPNSAELKFNEIPLQKATSISIKVNGEFTKLDKLLHRDRDGTPVNLSLGISLNGIPKVQLEAEASVDLQEKQVSAGLWFTLLDGKCRFEAPPSAIDAIVEAGQELQKHSVDNVADHLVEIAKVAETLYRAIKTIEDAKSKCVPGMIFGVGAFVAAPYGELNPSDPSSQGPSLRIGVSVPL